MSGRNIDPDIEPADPHAAEGRRVEVVVTDIPAMRIKEQDSLAAVNRRAGIALRSIDQQLCPRYGLVWPTYVKWTPPPSSSHGPYAL